MNSLPNGYSLREDGYYEKTVHFGKKGTAVETLIRDKRGTLITVVQQQVNADRREALSHRPWTERRRAATPK